MPLAGYLASGILTWAIPLGVLVVIGVYWAIFARRHPKEF
jgi:cytochrome c-type biogenesis protein CcmH/NrfF